LWCGVHVMNGFEVAFTFHRERGLSGPAHSTHS
jgi:hypothetical protein